MKLLCQFLGVVQVLRPQLYAVVIIRLMIFNEFYTCSCLRDCCGILGMNSVDGVMLQIENGTVVIPGQPIAKSSFAVNGFEGINIGVVELVSGGFVRGKSCFVGFDDEVMVWKIWCMSMAEVLGQTTTAKEIISASRGLEKKEKGVVIASILIRARMVVKTMKACMLTIDQT